MKGKKRQKRCIEMHSIYWKFKKPSERSEPIFIIVFYGYLSWQVCLLTLCFLHMSLEGIMDKIMSTRMDEAIIRHIGMLATKLGVSKTM